MAGHIDPAMDDVDDLLDGELTGKILEDIESHLSGGLSGEEALRISAQTAYVFSKRAVIRLCERRALAWGREDARIVSISPGLIHTPMGIKEAEANPQLSASLGAQPVPRWGTAMDVASSVEFLVGPMAGFITGCDLRVDGGATTLSRKR